MLKRLDFYRRRMRGLLSAVLCVAVTLGGFAASAAAGDTELLDDFSDGLTAKAHSVSGNLIVENRQQSGTPSQKNRVLRNDENGAEIVYQTEQDVIGFETLFYLESWNQKSGILSFHVSADGTNYTPLTDATETIQNTVGGSGTWARAVVSVLGGVPSGARYFKIVFADTAAAGVNYNPLLDTVRIFLTGYVPPTDKSALTALVTDALVYQKSHFQGAGLWSDFSVALSAARAVIDDAEATDADVADAVQHLQDAMDALEPHRVVIFDDFTGGLGDKAYSVSNLETEWTLAENQFPSDKWRVKRSGAASGEIVYQSEKDMISFEVVSFLHTSNRDGLPKFYAAGADGIYTPIDGAAHDFGGNWVWEQATASGAAAHAGIRYFKVELPDSATAGVDWNPFLDSVTVFL
ncbi:MAG: hypothetical protein LBH54_04245, partial [Clostridiales bacterium]|nr:hypothetical protein [Clostridiales bacterium]